MARNGKSDTLIKTFRNDNVTEVKQKNTETGQGAENAGKNPVAVGLETTHSRFSSMGRKRLRSQTERTATGAKTNDIDFGHLWRQLAGAGWSYKRPCGIETEWKYKSPDGLQVLVGEGAVISYALESGLLVEHLDGGDDSADVLQAATPTDTSVETSAPATQASPPPTETSVETSACPTQASPPTDTSVETSAPATQAAPPTDISVVISAFDEGEMVGGIRASQIDTSAQLSQGTLNDLFSSSSNSEVELSQTAVATAFNLSLSEIADHQDAATSVQLLSGGSGLENDAEADHETTPSSGRADKPRRDCTKDVNYIPDDADMDTYESFSSGGSDDNVEEDNDDSDELVRVDSDDGEDFLTDDNAVLMDEACVKSLRIGSDELSRETLRNREDALRTTEWGPLSSEFETARNAYPGLAIENARPVAAVRERCHSPLLTLSYFMPKSLWVMVCTETNRYGLQQVARRAHRIRGRQVSNRQETLKQISRRLKSKPGYQTHELLHVVGLVIARMLCPQKRRFAAHWSLVDDGAIPAGNIGRFMSRNRCQDILRDLHFVNNESERTRDKLWKLRPIIDKLQQRFLAAWTLPSVFSFDEGVLPATSRRNTTRMFMPDKSHRYGSKMFMTCDSRTAYCYRDTDTGDNSYDHKTGAAAVVRNLKIVLGSSTRQSWHLVVIDRFYSSIVLAIELLAMHVYVIGTIMTNRIGYDQRIKDKRQSRPVSIPRGRFTFSRSVAIPSMVSFHWWDHKPVHK
ncbi:unnamed protein product [Phytophthora fragariaefolia]|uniref:Unnamed protein product n=1 Tax=Phytophthora fragariaefolia TaxID=1490495 RepID=A0A9W6YCD9_9STRA|nr:unnamed protein product [Phytophthora fragariaefolia]